MSAPEEWRPVIGFEGFYEVSSYGRIRNIAPRKGTHVGRILKPTLNKRGYLAVSLMRGGVGTRVYNEVHRIVARAFLGERQPGDETRHLNGDPLDCRLSNLAYGSRSENTYDRVRHGVHHMAKRNCCKRGHEYTPENTLHEATRPGVRLCRVCRRASSRRSKLGRPDGVAA